MGGDAVEPNMIPTPVQLAEQIVRLVGDVDDNTARVALEIAKLLLIHRKSAEIEFTSDPFC